MIKECETTFQTFYSYIDNNKEFNNSVMKSVFPITIKYEVRKTMSSTIYFLRTTKFIYQINEILLRKYLLKKEEHLLNNE